MNWSSYEIFSVLSGVATVLLGLTPGGETRDRIWCVGGGVVLIAYGCYVACQDSGTYYFPMAIFFLPVVVGAVVAVKAVQRRRGTEDRG